MLLLQQGHYEAYREYIHTVVGYLQRDSHNNIPEPFAKARQVVDDVWFIETQIANVGDSILMTIPRMFP